MTVGPEGEQKGPGFGTRRASFLLHCGQKPPRPLRPRPTLHVLVLGGDAVAARVPWRSVGASPGPLRGPSAHADTPSAGGGPPGLSVPPIFVQVEPASGEQSTVRV